MQKLGFKVTRQYQFPLMIVGALVAAGILFGLVALMTSTGISAITGILMCICFIGAIIAACNLDDLSRSVGRVFKEDDE
jgi:hypothetical protein